MDAAGEIYNLQNCDFANDAKECVREQLLSCGGNERGSLRTDLMIKA